MKKVLLVIINNNEEVIKLDKIISDIYFADSLVINNNLSKKTIDKFNEGHVNNLNTPIKMNKNNLFKIAKKYAIRNNYDYLFQIDDVSLFNKSVDNYLKETLKNNVVLIENRINSFYRMIFNIIYKISLGKTFRGKINNNVIYDLKTLKLLENNNYNYKKLLKNNLNIKEII